MTRRCQNERNNITIPYILLLEYYHNLKRIFSHSKLKLTYLIWLEITINMLISSTILYLSKKWNISYRFFHIRGK